MLNYSVRDYSGIKIVELSGGLTSNSIETFKAFIKRLTEKESIIVNLENVSLITSAGVSAMVEVSFVAKEHDNRVIFLWPSDELLKIAEDMDVYSYIIFAHSIEEGQTKIKYFT